jgi:hypothetical protein
MIAIANFTSRLGTLLYQEVDLSVMWLTRVLVLIQIWLITYIVPILLLYDNYEFKEAPNLKQVSLYRSHSHGFYPVVIYD